MNDPVGSIAKQWQVRASSVIGASHKRTGTPNQDAGRAEVIAGGAGCVMAVADGHGDPLHARSDKGSKFAVAVAIETLGEWIRRQANAPEKQAQLAAAELPDQLLGAWRGEVARHLQANPLGNAEAELLRDAATPTALDGVLLYGSTLLAAASCERFAIYLQIGDGDILTVSGDQPPQRPISGRAGLAINLTESLCQPHASSRFKQKVEFFANKGRPDLILLATDGYANSFVDDDEFLAVGRDVKKHLERNDIDWVGRKLDQWLTQTSEKGSGDDITLALAWFRSPAVRQLPPQPLLPPLPPTRLPWRPAAVAVLLCLIIALGWRWPWIVQLIHRPPVVEAATLDTAGPVNAIAFSPNATLAAATDRGWEIWDIPARKLLVRKELTIGRATTIESLPGNRLLAVGSDNSIQIFDAAAGNVVEMLPEEAWHIASAALSPDGESIAFAAGNTAWIWTFTQKALRFFSGHNGRVTSVAFAGQHLVSAGTDGTIKIWDIEQGNEVRSIPAHAGAVDALAVSPHGETLASAVNGSCTGSSFGAARTDGRSKHSKGRRSVCAPWPLRRLTGGSLLAWVKMSSPSTAWRTGNMNSMQMLMH